MEIKDTESWKDNFYCWIGRTIKSQKGYSFQTVMQIQHNPNQNTNSISLKQEKKSSNHMKSEETEEQKPFRPTSTRLGASDPEL